MKRSGANCLTRKSHPCSSTIAQAGLHENLTIMSKNNHQNRTFSFGQVVFLCCVLLPLVQSANAMTRPEFSCIEGQSLPRFKRCTCGEYAQVLTKEDEQRLDEAGVQVFYRGMKPYVCIQCTRCGDGVKVDRQCARRDTQCSDSECTNRGWTYDFGSKSCRPSATAKPKTTTVLVPTTARTPAREPRGPIQQEPWDLDDKDDLREDSPLWSQKQGQFIIVGVVAVVILLLILLVAIVILVLQMKKQLQKITTSSPYSSQNTSNSSVNV